MNYTLSIIQAIASFFVVLVHFQFPSVFGKCVCSLGVAGVIVFFLSSGFFAFDSKNPLQTAQKVARRFKKNVRLLLIVVLIYFAITAIEKIVFGTFAEWILNFTNPILWIRLIILGDFEIIHGDPLWYLLATLYCYGIFAFLSKKNLFKVAYFFLPALIFLRIAMETYTNSFGADWHLSGNAIVGALPMMLLGHFIAFRRAQKTHSSKESQIFAVAMAFSAILLFVFSNVRVFGFDISQIFKIALATSAFLFALEKPNATKPRFLIFTGAYLSVWIYLFHNIIGIVIKDALTFLESPKFVFDWILPPFVILISVFVALLIFFNFRNKNLRRK